jgi:hypothetical protein
MARDLRPSFLNLSLLSPKGVSPKLKNDLLYGLRKAIHKDVKNKEEAGGSPPPIQ